MSLLTVQENVSLFSHTFAAYLQLVIYLQINLKSETTLVLYPSKMQTEHELSDDKFFGVHTSNYW